MNWITIWASYVRSRWKPMLAIVLVAAPLMLMAYIYEMPMDALCYAAGLSLFLVAIIALIDGYHFLRTHRALHKAKD